MPFGKNKDEASAAQGRYVVEHVPVMVSGKKLLQQKLNEGDQRGWTLHNVMNSDKHDWILVVWERPRLATMQP